MRHSLFLILVVLVVSCLASVTRPAQADTVSVTGSCPGDLTFTLTGFDSETTVSVLMANRTGGLRIPGGYTCAGTRLGLSGAGIRVIIVFFTDEFGFAEYTLHGPRPVCGRYVQAITTRTCETSNVARIPLP